MTLWSREDPREWNSENVTTFVRSLGTPECFQSTGDQVLQLGVDGSVQSSSHYPSTTSKVCGNTVDRVLSEAVVKTWVDNYKPSLNRKKQSEKDTDPKDKDQE
jgi:hypothetical protein